MTVRTRGLTGKSEPKPSGSRLRELALRSDMEDGAATHWHPGTGGGKDSMP